MIEDNGSQSGLDSLLPVSSKLLVSEIQEKVRKAVAERKKRYLSLLRDEVPSAIDVDIQGEFLLRGWYDPEPIGGVRARWTSKMFSFLFNANGSDTLYLNVVGLPRGLESTSVSLIDGGKSIGTVQIRVPGYYAFPIPKRMRSGVHEFVFVSSNSIVPMHHKHGPDAREIGVGIKTISRTLLIGESTTHISEIENTIRKVCLIQHDLRSHENPESRLPRNARFLGVKRLFFRAMRPYSAVQTAYNNLVTTQFQSITKLIERLFVHLQKLESEINQSIVNLRAEIQNKRPYRSAYLDKHRGEFYAFYRERFYGSEQNTSENIKQYLSHLKKIAHLAPHSSFVCAGLVPKEFLKLLHQEGIFPHIVGVDLQAATGKQTKEIELVHEPIHHFLTHRSGEICGMSVIHLFERFSFDQQFDLLHFAFRKLMPGGIIIIETANPETASANRLFYLDSECGKPIPPFLLSIMAEFIGYKIDAILPISPRTASTASKDPNEYWDYVLIARKPL